MFLFYGYGAGLGHLNRIHNFIYTKKIPLKECVILTNSSFANYIPKPVTIIYKNNTFFKNKNTCSLFIEEYLKTHPISTFIVDVFPAGFYGEFEKGFNHLKNTSTILLARILKDIYFETYTSPKYDKIYTIEDGITLQHYSSKNIIPFNLEIKPISNNSMNSIELKKTFFLIIHSAPIEEVYLLYKQALLYRTNEQIYIYTFSPITFNLEEDTVVILKEKIHFTVLDKASKIFTGCGFNSTLETKKHRKKQHIIPFKRKYDDQFKRKYMLGSKNLE